MAWIRFRRLSFITHSMQGWWWAKRYNYPSDEHAVRIPVYAWVDAEAAAPKLAQAELTAPPQTMARPTVTGERLVQHDEPFAAFLVDA